MDNLFNPEVKFTQKQVAYLLGLASDKQVRNLTNSGILPAAVGRNGMDPLRCIHAYIAYKTQTSKKPETPHDFEGEKAEVDYEHERALNVREQRRARRIQNELAIKTLIPTEVCVQIFGSLVAAARSKVLAIEGQAAAELQSLDAADRQTLRTLLHEALTDLSDEPIPASLRAYLDECEFDLDAAAEPDD